MPANTLLTTTVVGIREDLEDMIYNTSPTDTPFISSIDRTAADNTLHEWQIDTLRAPAANAATEGADATFAAQTQPTRPGNRTQIFTDTFSVSGTTEAVRKAGRKNNSEVQRLKMKKMIECKKDMELAFIVNGTSTATATRTARGLYGFLSTNSSSGAGGAAPNSITNTAPTVGTLRPITETLYKAALQSMYTSGGKIEDALTMVSPAHKPVYSTFTGNVVRQQTVPNSGANVTLNTSFTFYGSDFGTTKVIPNRVMAGAFAGAQSTDYILDLDQFAVATLPGRGWQSIELSKTGDASNWEVLTEATLVSRVEAASAAIRDITVTGL